MSKARNISYWYNFNTRAEEKAFVKGWEFALMWLHDREELDLRNIINLELKDICEE